MIWGDHDVSLDEDLRRSWSAGLGARGYGRVHRKAATVRTVASSRAAARRCAGTAGGATATTGAVDLDHHENGDRTGATKVGVVRVAVVWFIARGCFVGRDHL